MKQRTCYTNVVFSSLRTRPLEWIFSALLVCSVLWKGGKSIDITWISAFTIGVIFFCGWIGDRFDPAARSKRLQEYRAPSYVRILSLLAIAGTICSYIFSKTLNYGLDEVLRTIFYVLAFLWIVRLREQRKTLWLETELPYLLAATTIVSALIGTAIYLLQPVTRFVGTFVDPRFHTDYWPNAWAEFALLGIPMLLYCCTQSASKKWIWGSGCVLVCSSLYLSYSRGGMIACLGAMSILVAVSAINARNNIALRRYLRVHAVSIGATLIAILFSCGVWIVGVNAIRSIHFPLESITQKIAFKAAEGTSSVYERSAFWNQAVEMIQQKPFLGFGPYSFRFVQPASMTSVLATSDHPHNAVLKMAAERGVPTASMFVFLFASILISLMKRIWKKDSTITFFHICAYGAVWGVLLHTLIDYNIQFVGIGLPLFVLLGFLVPLDSTTDARRASFLRWKIDRRFSDISALFACLMILLAVREGWFLVTSSFGRHALAAGNEEIALEWFNRSHQELFSRDLFLAEAQLYQKKSQTGAAIAAVEYYQQRNAYDPRAWRLRGEILLQSGDAKGAILALQQAYTLGRYTDIGITRLLIQAYLAHDASAMSAYKETFDSVFRMFADAVNVNTHFIALSENVEELTKVSRLLSEAFPADAQRYESIAREAHNHAEKERGRYTKKNLGILW